MGDSEKQSYMRGQKTLEINPYHPLIQELKTKVHFGAECARIAVCMSAGAPQTKQRYQYQTLRQMGLANAWVGHVTYSFAP